MDEIEAPGAEPTRRAVLMRTAAVGGSLLWAAPVVQALNVSVADAASLDQPDGTGDEEPPPPPPPPVVSQVLAHGLFVVRLVTTTPAATSTLGVVGLPVVTTVEYAYSVSSEAVVGAPSAADLARLGAYPGVSTSGTPWGTYRGRVATAYLGERDLPARIGVVLPEDTGTVTTMPLAEDFRPGTPEVPAGSYEKTVAVAGFVGAFRGH